MVPARLLIPYISLEKYYKFSRLPEMRLAELFSRIRRHFSKKRKEITTVSAISRAQMVITNFAGVEVLFVG